MRQERRRRLLWSRSGAGLGWAGAVLLALASGAVGAAIGRGGRPAAVPPPQAKPAPRPMARLGWREAERLDAYRLCSDRCRELVDNGGLPGIPGPADPATVRGDGKPFGLMVEMVSDSDGAVLEGALRCGTPYPPERHPKYDPHLPLPCPAIDPDRARATYASFGPGCESFSAGGKGWDCEVIAFVYQQPPGGTYTIRVPSWTVSGRVVDPAGRGLPGRAVVAMGTTQDIPTNLPGSVRFVSCMVRGVSDEAGRFTLGPFVPGDYVIVSSPNAVAARQPWRATERVVHLGPVTEDLQIVEPGDPQADQGRR